MTLKGDAKFKRKLTLGLKNLVNFNAISRNSEKLHLDGLFFSNAYKFLD